MSCRLASVIRRPTVRRSIIVCFMPVSRGVKMMPIVMLLKTVMAGCARRPVNTCPPVRIPNIRSVIAAGMARQGMSMDITASALLLRAERVIPVIQISHIPQTYRIQGCVKSRGPKPVRQTRTVRQRRGALTDGASSGNDALSMNRRPGDIPGLPAVLKSFRPLRLPLFSGGTGSGRSRPEPCSFCAQVLLFHAARGSPAKFQMSSIPETLPAAHPEP